MSFLRWAMFALDLFGAILEELGDNPETNVAFLKTNPCEPGRPSKQEPPHAPGGYRWRNKETGKVDYIGISNDLKKRYKQHVGSKRFSDNTHDYEWKKAKSGMSFSDLRKKEKDYINKHNPSGNRNSGGGGRNPQN